jgi:outer membrane protein assembly factor BamB
VAHFGAPLFFAPKVDLSPPCGSFLGFLSLIVLKCRVVSGNACCGPASVPSVWVSRGEAPARLQGGIVFGFYLVVTSVEAWRAVTGGAVTGALTVANGQVFVGSGDDNLYAYDLTGSGQTKQPAPRPDPATLHPNWELQPV